MKSTEMKRLLSRREQNAPQLSTHSILMEPSQFTTLNTLLNNKRKTISSGQLIAMDPNVESSSSGTNQTEIIE